MSLHSLLLSEKRTLRDADSNILQRRHAAVKAGSEDVYEWLTKERRANAHGENLPPPPTSTLEIYHHHCGDQTRDIDGKDGIKHV